MIKFVEKLPPQVNPVVITVERRDRGMAVLANDSIILIVTNEGKILRAELTLNDIDNGFIPDEFGYLADSTEIEEQ